MFVIVGPTGHTGGAAAEALLAQKKNVRVVVRSADKGRAWQGRGAEVAVASVEDTAALTTALRGAQGAYLLIPPDFGAEDVLGRARRIVDAFVGAITGSGIPHVVFLSSVGGQLAEGSGIVKSTHIGEEKLRRLPLAVTFLRAGYFIENWGGLLPVAAEKGILPTALTLDRKVPMVATKDIGGVAASALLDPPSAGAKKIIELAGPEDLSPHDVAAAMSKVLAKPINAVAISLVDLKGAFRGMGASADTAEKYAELEDGFNRGHVTWERQGATFVRGKTDIDTVLRGLRRG